MMKLTILGNNSAIPSHGRHPSSQVLEIKEQLFLIDCGEGTQLQLQKYNVRKRRINHVFISHLHGDHYFGLIGLITSMGLLGRTSPLHIYAPAPLEGLIIQQLSLSDTSLPYEIVFRPIYEQERSLLLDGPAYSVRCFPVEHRIPCHGFLFTAKGGGRKIAIEHCKAAGVPASVYAALKAGEDYINEKGERVPNEALTLPPPADIRYAYCADTRYTRSFLKDIQGCDAVYHESTYLSEHADKAYERYHSTAAQAAELALAAGAGHLLLGHFSSRYDDLKGFHKEAGRLFPGSTVTEEGATYKIDGRQLSTAATPLKETK